MLLSTLVALSLVAAPPKPFTHVATVEGVSEYTLPNGLKVLFVPDASKSNVTVNLTVFVGSRHENYGEKGMAHLFEHMLFKETKNFKDVKKALTEHGAKANGSTWFDRTNYFETFPASDDSLKWALTMEADRLVNAIISREKLAPEMTVVRNEMEMGENNPARTLMDRVASAAFTWHNYGMSTIGPRSDIETVPSERLVAFYKNYYQPDNAMLVVAGKFDEAKAFATIGSTFGAIARPTRKLINTYTVEPTQDGERSVMVRRVGGTPWLATGYHVPAGTDPEYAAIEVITSVLGTKPAGRLYKGLVDTKKAASVSCMSFELAEPGFLLCMAELRATDNPAAAREALISGIEDLSKKKVTAEEVERAKAEYLKGFELRMNQSERVGVLFSEAAATGDWRMLFLQRDRVRAITADEVNRVAEKYFKASNRTLGEYVPTEKPDRAEVPAVADLTPILKDYKGDQAVAQGETFDSSPANIDKRTVKTALPNGLKLAMLSKKTRGETVRITMRFPYGSEKSLENLETAADFLASMLSRGTKNKTRQEYTDALDKLKAAVRYSASPQSLNVGIEVRRPQLAATLDLVAEAVKSPRFEPTEFESLRREELAGAEQSKDDPNAIGSVALQKSLSAYKKGHPLYVPSWDEVIADANAVKLEQAKDFHARFYGAQAGYVAAVGDFDEKELTEKLTALFGSWTAKEQYTRIPTPYAKLEVKRGSVQTPDKAMAFFGASMAIPLKDSDADYPAMLLGNFMLGGGFLAGRVPQRLREKDGLSYGAGTSMRAGDHFDKGTFVGYAIYAPQNVDKVEKGFFEEVDRAVDKGFTDEELKAARSGLLQQRAQNRADDGSLAGRLVDQMDLGRSMTFEAGIDERLGKISVAEVGTAMKKYVDTKNLSVVKVGDFKKVTAPK